MLSKYETLNNYISLKFTEKLNSKIHNPWEMFSRASKISSFIYKSKILDSLTEYYEQDNEICIKNIFIIDNDYIKEYQIEHLINNLHKHKKYEALNEIFSFGRIYFMMPNFFYLRLYEIYEYKFKLNNITKDYQFKCINESIFNDLINKYFNSSNLSSIDIINEISQIAEKRLKKIKNKKIVNNILSKINDLSYEYKDKIQVIRSFEKSSERKEIELLINQNKISKIENTKLYYYYNLYYNKFSKHFKNSRKPIIGVFNNEHIGTFDIFLKYSLFYQSKYKLNFINLKKLSHNSPLIVEIAVGIGTISGVIFGIFEGLNRIKKGKLENEEKEIDIEQKKLDLLEKKITFEKKFLIGKINDYKKNLINKYQSISEIYEIEIIDNKTLDEL